MMRHLIIAVASLLLICGSMAAEAGQDVKVCIFPMKPLNFIDDEGTAQGLYPDILREIVRQEGWSITFIPGSWRNNFV